MGRVVDPGSAVPSWFSDAVSPPDAAVSTPDSRADVVPQPVDEWTVLTLSRLSTGSAPGCSRRRGLVVGSGAGGPGRRAGAGEGCVVGGAGAGDGCVAVFAGGGGAAGCGSVGGFGGGVGAAGVAEPGGPVRGVVAGVGARDAGDDWRAVCVGCAASGSRSRSLRRRQRCAGGSWGGGCPGGPVDGPSGGHAGRGGRRGGSRRSWTRRLWWRGWRRWSGVAGSVCGRRRTGWRTCGCWGR